MLEAMAMGLPVVGTSKGHEGLEARPGRDLLVEDDPEKFADLVVRLLRNATLRAELGRAARQFVEAHHSWKASMARLDRLLATVIRRPELTMVHGHSPPPSPRPSPSPRERESLRLP